MKKNKESGQSIVEFAFLVPIIVIMLQLLVEVNSAINTAIVNQKYSRQTLEYLFFNHRYYPEINNTITDTNEFRGRFFVGVDDKIRFLGEDDDLDDSQTARAPERSIGRLPGQNDGDTQEEFPEINSRQKVRIRVLTFTCVPPLGIKAAEPFAEGNIGENTFLSGNYTYCE